MPLRTPSLAAIRRATAGACEDGTIRLLFVREAGRIGLVQTPVETATADTADQFLVRYLQQMIVDVAAPGVVVAVHRGDGRQTHADRQLWHLLRAGLEPSSTVLLDLVTLGTARAWSARRGAPLNPPRRPSQGRRSASREAAR